MSKTNNPKSAWKGSGAEIEKPWGSVISWSAIQSIGGKIIKINKGERTSLKYNSIKDEVLFVISGSVIVSTWSIRKNPDQSPELRSPLSPGDTFNIQSEIPFRLTALEDSYIVEISNGKNNQIVRFEDDYGRADEES
jgi:mannose-6-phosphate isomerase-like protein (cupin superfamily)